MFENMNTPPESIKSKSDAMGYLLDLMIELEEDPRKKTMMCIPKQCSVIAKKLKWFVANTAKIDNENISMEKAKATLEYLSLVEIGIDNFIDSQKGNDNV